MTGRREEGMKGTLRRRVLLGSVGGMALAVVGLAAILLLHRRVESELVGATGEFMEEQVIADGIDAAVLRQILLASALRAGSDSVSMTELMEAGEVVHRHFRQYLFRDLTTDQRLRLERVRESQERLEVAAVRAAELYRQGDREGGDEALRTMAVRGLELNQALGSFIEMREEGLHALRGDQERMLGTVYWAGVGFAGLLLVFSLGTGRLLHRRVARPLQDLAEAVDRVGEGELDARVATGEYDAEFALLGDQFNRMAERLQVLRADLERRNRELAGAMDRIQEARAELLRSEKLTVLGEMTAGLVHELNNPLSSILGYGELLEEELTSPEGLAWPAVRRDFVTPMVAEARRAHHLVRNLLLFSRRGGLELKPVDVAAAMDVVVGLRAFEFESAGLVLEVEGLQGLRVVGERQRLQESFLNLINNALHALKSGGGSRLHIHGRSEAGQVEIVFDDDGPGFVDPQMALEPFYTTKAEDEGTGLGLALVSRYVEEFGGVIRIENRAEGGARVELELSEAEEDGSEEGRPGRESRDASLPPPGFARGLRILVVEDEAHLRMIHRRLLERAGASVVLSTNGMDARERVEEDAKGLDLVISDVKMPGGGGLPFYRWLRAQHPALARRFIFVTGDIQSEEVVEIAQTHPELFLRKPFEMNEYLARVHAALS